MIIHRQVWMAFVATFVLAVLTLLLLVTWDQKASQINESKIKSHENGMD
jgi:hypothetical protein